MDLAEIVRVMRRRWYVMLPGLLLTAVLVAGAYRAVAPTYRSQSTVVLLNSQKATVAFDGNPYLSTQLSLNGMADSLARNLNSDVSLTELKSRGATATTQAKIADNALGPLLWLTASGTDQRAVLATDRLLTSYAAERLRQFQTQQDVAPQAMIRMATIVSPQNPVAQTKTRTEYLALAGLMGLVISLVATFYVEARLRSTGRRGVRGARAGGPGGERAAARRTAEDAYAYAYGDGYEDPADGGSESGAGDGPGPAGVAGPPFGPSRSGAAPARHTPRWSVPDTPNGDGPDSAARRPRSAVRGDVAPGAPGPGEADQGDSGPGGSGPAGSAGPAGRVPGRDDVNADTPDAGPVPGGPAAGRDGHVPDGVGRSGGAGAPGTGARRFV